MSQCRMTNKSGKRCLNNCFKNTELCLIHYLIFVEKTKDMDGKIPIYIGIAGGIIPLIPVIIDIWKHIHLLAKGTREDEDFIILARSYPASPLGTTVSLYLHFDTYCDWRALRDIVARLETIKDKPFSSTDAPTPILEFENWYNSLQPGFRELIEKQVAQSFD